MNRTVLAVGLVMAVATACGSDGGSSAPTTSAAATSVPASEPGAGTTVKLEEAGAQPREPMRLRIAAGSTQRAAFVAKTAMEMKMGDEEVSTGPVPATRFVIEQHVDSVDADGTAHYTMTFADVSVVATPGADPELVSQTEATLRQMEGISGKATADPRGGNQQLTFDTSRITDSTLKSTIESMSSQIGNLTTPFPVEPVGLGARWVVTRRATISGITLNMATTFTLRERAGDTYRLDSDQTGTAPTGPVAIPNLPAGTRASVEKFALHSQGEASGSLTQLLPENSTVAGEGDTTLTVTDGSDSRTLEQHMVLDFSLTPA
ncbi:MAG: hypothetical protein ACR2HV_07870 [Acidimicrobiales bacterium]